MNNHIHEELEESFFLALAVENIQLFCLNPPDLSHHFQFK